MPKADNTSLPQKIRALEYRLSTQLQKFNQAVAENRSMRERIDALRKERVVFDVIYRQLESDIKTKREELISMMQKTEKAEKARDDTKMELEKARVEAAKMKELFAAEWSEVVERSLKEQNETIPSAPGTQESGKQGRKLGSAEKSGNSHHHENDQANSYANKLRSIVARAAWNIARDTGYIHVSLAKV